MRGAGRRGGLIVAMVLLGAWRVAAAQPAPPLYAWVVGGCDLHRAPCQATLHDGRRIALSITPREIPLLKPLTVAVRLEGFEAASVELRFTGVDIDMGELRYPLSMQGEGRYSGTASLGICSRMRMTWQVLVVVKGTGWVVQAPFRFATEYRPSFTLIE